MHGQTVAAVRQCCSFALEPVDGIAREPYLGLQPYAMGNQREVIGSPHWTGTDRFAV